ncbi:ankyrin repeat domain-containing protein 28, partial [Colletotrichum plurivorum]
MRRLSAAHLYLFLLTCAIGTAQADGWDDFSNNLAADLAPILALFGEQITKQFLSESTTIWDNFIFAMAPLGVITAVVSAIRVCGGSSLRAFIGRAQEGGGIAEAELCSSTSRDVCELYHNGAIVRVFGRPKILEIVHDRVAADKDFSRNDQTPAKCGIYSSRECIGTERAGWKEIGKHSREPRKTEERPPDEEKGPSDTSGQQLASKASTDNDEFAPNPNLSFNIGIRKRPVWVQWLAAAIAFLAQVSVLVFGGLVTSWGWKKEEDIPPAWAFPLMSLGTVLLCGGMFYCAFLVEKSTKERVFRKANNKNNKGKEESQNSSSPPSTIYVVQPGNQVIGDQTFDPFLFDDSANPINQYITSWKTPEKSGDQLGVWLAIAMTMTGFVLQFVGLRAMHSAVSVLQLGAILVVSFIRAVLRTQRLRKEDNRLHYRLDEVEGHELDWLALQIGNDKPGNDKPGEEEYFSWVVTSPAAGLHSAENREDNTEANGSGSNNGHSKKTSNHGSQKGAQIEKKTNTAPRSHSGLGAVARTFYYRSRLAELTSQSRLIKAKSSTAWDTRLVPARQLAQQLKKAIESSVRLLFPNGAEPLIWNFYAAASCPGPERVSIHIPLQRDSEWVTAWDTIQQHLEAMIGLWTWSIISDPRMEETDEFNFKVSKASEVPAFRIMAVGATREELERAKIDMQFWTDAFPSLESRKLMVGTGRMDLGPDVVWEVDKKDGTIGSTSAKTKSSLSSRSQQLLRLFGWQFAALPTSDGSSTEVFVSTTSLPLGHSISTACALDIYQSFLCASMRVLDSIGGQTKFSKGSRGFCLENEVISGLVECFKESSLGSTQDAFSVILPVLQCRSKLPYPTDTLPFTYNTAEDLSKGGKEVTALLLDRRGEQIIIAEEVVKAAAGNTKNGKDVMALFLDRQGDKIIMTDEVVKAAAGNKWNGKEVMTLLLDRRGKEITITKEVVKAAAGNKWSGEEVMTLLLDRRGKEITITEEVVKAGAGNEGNGKEVMTLLLDRRGKEITITEEVVKAGAGNEESGEEVITLLLYRRGDQVPITEEVVKAVARNERDGERVMRLLLDRRGDQVPITDEVVKAVAGNKENGKEVMALLLDRRGDEIIITKEVVKAAAGNKGNGEEVITLLLDRRGKEITITEEVVKAGVGNEESGEEVITLLLDRRGDQVPITDEVVKAAAGNKENGKEVMALLLDRRGDEITITKEVVKAAAGNEGNGKEVMTLLLDRRGKEITITEEVVKAGAGNEESGKEVMTLLLDRRGKEITITKEVVKAAAGN